MAIATQFYDIQLAKEQKSKISKKKLFYMNVIIDTLCGFSNNSVFVSHKERRKLYVGKTGQFTSH